MEWRINRFLPELVARVVVSPPADRVPSIPALFFLSLPPLSLSLSLLHSRRDEITLEAALLRSSKQRARGKTLVVATPCLVISIILEEIRKFAETHAEVSSRRPCLVRERFVRVHNSRERRIVAAAGLYAVSGTISTTGNSSTTTTTTTTNHHHHRQHHHHHQPPLPASRPFKVHLPTRKLRFSTQLDEISLLAFSLFENPFRDGYRGAACCFSLFYREVSPLFIIKYNLVARPYNQRIPPFSILPSLVSRFRKDRFLRMTNPCDERRGGEGDRVEREFFKNCKLSSFAPSRLSREKRTTPSLRL